MGNNDLISRSALLSGFDVRKVTEYDESGCGVDYKAVPVEAIENAPAVDAEPVRHGRWNDLGWDGDSSWQIDGRGRCWHVYACSECDARNCGGPKTKYCPVCGAKMDADIVNDIEE